MKYKCLNPGCRHEWETRGDYAKIIRCTSCRKGYVLDWDTFEAAVLAEVKWLTYPSSFLNFLLTHSRSSTRRHAVESKSQKERG